MSPSRDEHLERLGRHDRHDETAGERRTLARVAAGVLGGALVVALGAWWLVGAVDLPAEGADPWMGRFQAWMLRQRADALLAPSNVGEPTTFEIAPGEGLPSVAERLEAAGFIRDADAFRWMARLQGIDRSVQAGAHTLRPDMSAQEVLDALQIALGDAITVTIPEGFRLEETAALLAGNGLVERDEMIALAASGAPTGGAAVDARPEGAGLEGYLFPDTYQFEPDAGAEAVIGVLVDTFEARFDAERRRSAGAAGLSIHEVVTLASIVEREAVVNAERPMIARVFLNRLATPPYILNADPTVQYGLGFQVDLGTWWKRPLYEADLAIDTPYNSYLRPGLPPGPIASPGLASIDAVLVPADGDWQYFVADELACDGTHVFAETYEAHLENVRRYRSGGCGP